MRKFEYLQVLTGEALVEWHGYLCEIYAAKDLKLHFMDVNNGEHRFTTTYEKLATSNEFEFVSRQESSETVADVYEIIYDYTDNDGIGTSITDIREEFIGSWSDLQVYIKKLCETGCYNIIANSIGW